MRAPKYALLSVTDKTGLADLGKGLIALGYNILSTSGSAQVLKAAGCIITEVSDYTGFSEILSGRVKTLHPKIYAGILHRRTETQDNEELEGIQGSCIDLVCVNFYDFAARKNTALNDDDLAEAVDIGGPCLLRAAAKNHGDVIALSDPADYNWVLKELATEEGVSKTKRQALAAKAFKKTSSYDEMIASSFQSRNRSKEQEAHYDEELQSLSKKIEYHPLRYGENAHQKGYFGAYKPASLLADIHQWCGKELSYNNYLDMDGACGLIREFPGFPAMTIIKHTNPCGFALAYHPNPSTEQNHSLWLSTLHGDQLSSYGGIFATSVAVNASLAQHIGEHFLEVVMAPAFTGEAKEVLQRKKQLRVIEAPWLQSKHQEPHTKVLKQRSVLGGILVQQSDHAAPHLHELSEDAHLPTGWQVMTQRLPSPQQIRDLTVALKVVKHTKSNGVVVLKEGVLYGVGCGMSSRIDAARWSLTKASSHNIKSGVMASDAFFPFGDVVELAAQHHIAAIVTPRGSIRDQLSVEAAQRCGIILIFSDQRHFRH